MTDAPAPFESLVANAHDTHVVVIGGGIAGLVAALECAKVGMPVTLLEAADELGGTIASAEIEGVPVDLGTTCWSARGAAVEALVEELGLGDRVVEPLTEQTWIAGLPKGAAAPVPADSLLGIPANPWDESVRRIIGGRAVWRAYVDRLRPPLTIGAERNLGKLVRARMGDAVVDDLVAPLTVGRFALTPDEVDVAVAAPGLNSALTRAGSLGGAVADLLVDRADGPSVRSLESGMPQLVAALSAKLTDLGARVVTGAPVASLVRADERWHIERESGTDAAPGRAGDADDPITVDPADIVVVATGLREALRLLAPFVDDALAGTAVPRSVTLRDVVTLVVDAPALDAAPRGAEVYAVPGSHRASGVVHQTARWGWLAAAAGPGRHVLSVAFDGPAAAHPTTGLPDAEIAELARTEAAALLGVPLEPASVRGARRRAFELAPPVSALGHGAVAESVRAAIAAQPGLAAVGAWMAGSGLARVTADAVDQADRARRSALWGGSART